MEIVKSHSKLLTVIMSMLLPGSGHFYLGYPLKAFLFLSSIIVLNYGFMYIYTIYVSSVFVILSLLIFLTLYLYIIYDALHIFKIKQDKYKKYNHWIITILVFIPMMYILLLIKNIMPIRTFYIPSISMENTVLKGDCLVAIKEDTLQRGELNIFRYPHNQSIFYLKRCVAIGGDEIIYVNKKLLIHFHEGNTYIKEHYPVTSIIEINKKLWVVNPYTLSANGIRYKPNYDSNSYKILIQYASTGNIGMQPILLPTFKSEYFTINNKKFNAFYTEIESNHYFMMGDNRDNSNDSRFLGSIPSNLLFGKPSVIYFHISNDFSINWSRIGIKLNKAIDKNSI